MPWTTVTPFTPEILGGGIRAGSVRVNKAEWFVFVELFGTFGMFLFPFRVAKAWENTGALFFCGISLVSYPRGMAEHGRAANRSTKPPTCYAAGRYMSTRICPTLFFPLRF